MNKKTIAVVGVTVAAVLAAGTPSALAAGTQTGGTAHAGQATVGVVSPQTIDGYVRAWTGTYRSGTQCAWSGNAATWGTCSAHVGSVENDGYVQTYDDVNFYYQSSQGGAWACIGQGSYWLDLSAGQQSFSHGAGLPGYGQSPFNNIRSHAWTTSCA